jgi:hypothetical protein
MGALSNRMTRDLLDKVNNPSLVHFPAQVDDEDLVSPLLAGYALGEGGRAEEDRVEWRGTGLGKGRAGRAARELE